MEKETLLIKIAGYQEDPSIVSLRKQLVGALGRTYSVVFLSEDVEISDIEFKFIK